MKTPDYLTYERYKKNKKKDESKNGMILGITTFFITLLLFTIIAKGLSPDVDVAIGDDSAAEPKETGLGVKKYIDERLKSIQMEDTGSNTAETTPADRTSKGYNDASFNKYSEQILDEEEKVNLPANADKSAKSKQKDRNLNSASTAAHTPPRPSAKDLSTPFASPKSAKVYVGRYSTLEQAKVAQEILIDSGLDITPFVKNTGSSYTLQVGSYSSRSKAEGVASELQRNSFPARVIQE